MQRKRLLVYNPFSASARALSRALSVKRIRDVDNTAFVPRAQDVVINWGRGGELPRTWLGRGRMLNSPEAVRVACNKKLAFEVLISAGVRVPKFTTDVAVARKWARKRIVFGRRLLRSSSGKGIEIYKKPEDVREGLPLYVRYTPKIDEYRVHVFDGEVVDVQKKMRRSGVFEGDPETRNMVRNYSNGWIFGRSNISPPEDVIVQSLVAVGALGLTFGAVDVGWTANIEVATVYEVNTAPGLTGTTLATYVRKFKGVLQGW